MPLSTTLRPFIAAAAGALLHQAVLVDVGGRLAAIAVPAAYFETFGRSNLAAALALLHLLSFALPIFILLTGGLLAAQRLLGGRNHSVLGALLAGMLGGCAFWLADSLLQMPGGVGLLLPLLLSSSWQGLPGLLAPWAAFACAVWLLKRPARRGLPA